MIKENVNGEMKIDSREDGRGGGRAGEGCNLNTFTNNGPSNESHYRVMKQGMANERQHGQGAVCVWWPVVMNKIHDSDDSGQ